jgi:hypothetical protein
MRCWKRSPLGKPQRFHRCTRSLNAVCKCKMCTSAFSMDGQRWFRCRWWSVDSPLHPRRHRRRCLTQDRLHRPPWMSIWRHHHRLRRLQRQLLVVRHLHQCLWSSGLLLPVVDSPHVPSMLPVDALSSLAIVQMEWPRLPPPTGGPNGPRSGRLVGRLGGGGGERRSKPRRGRDLHDTASALRGTRLAQRHFRRGPRSVARAHATRARAREQALGAASTRARPRASRVEREVRSVGSWWPDLARARPDPPYGVGERGSSLAAALGGARHSLLGRTRRTRRCLELLLGLAYGGPSRPRTGGERLRRRLCARRLAALGQAPRTRAGQAASGQARLGLSWATAVSPGNSGQDARATSTWCWRLGAPRPWRWPGQSLAAAATGGG